MVTVAAVFRVSVPAATAVGLTAAFVAEDRGAGRVVVADALVADGVAAIVASDRWKKLGIPISVAAATMAMSAYVIVREAGHPFVTGTPPAVVFALRATVVFVERD
jgi:hypothetical protein